MAEELANDYSGYFKASNLDQEVNKHNQIFRPLFTNRLFSFLTQLKPITVGIDRMMLRLEEFENLLELVKAESALALNQNIPQMLALQPELNALCDRIDKLEQFVGLVGRNLDAVEKQVQVAEEELDIPDKTINVLLKSLNIFGKPKQTEKLTNRNANGVYEPVPVFKTEQFFRPNGPEKIDKVSKEETPSCEDCDTGTPEI